MISQSLPQETQQPIYHSVETNFWIICVTGARETVLKLIQIKKDVNNRTKNKVVICGIELVLGNKTIHIVSSVKCIGVVFSDTLNWHIHVDNA